MKEIKGNMVSGYKDKPSVCLMLSPPPHNASLFNLESMKWEPDSYDSGTVAMGTIDTEAFLKFVEYEQRNFNRENKESNGVLSSAPSLKVSLPLNLVTFRNRKRCLGDNEDCGGMKKSKLGVEKLEKDTLEDDLDLSESEDNCSMIEGIDMNEEEMANVLHFNQMIMENGDIDIFSPKKNIVDTILKSPSPLHIYLPELSSPKINSETNYPDPNFARYSSNNSEDTRSICSMVDSDSTVEIKLPKLEKIPEEMAKIDIKSQAEVLNKYYETLEFQEEIISEHNTESVNSECEENYVNDSCSKERIEEIVETVECQIDSKSMENVVKTVPPISNQLSSRNVLDTVNNYCEELDYEADELEIKDNNGNKSSLESGEITDSEEDHALHTKSLTPSPQTQTKVKWNSKEILKKLSDKVPENERLNILRKNSNEPKEKSTVVTASSSAQNSDSDLEIFPRCDDDIDEEFSKDSADIRNKVSKVPVRSNTDCSRGVKSSTKPISRSNSLDSQPTKQSLQTEKPSNLEGNTDFQEGLYGKVLDGLRKDLLIDNPNYKNIGMRLKEVVTKAVNKELIDIIKQCCDIFVKCFKNLPDYLAQVTFKSLLLATKNLKDALRDNLITIYKAITQHHPFKFQFRNDTWEILFELFIDTYPPDWSLVIKSLHFSMGVCKIIPHAKWVNSVLAALPEFPGLLKTAFKLLTKPCGQKVFPKLDIELLKNFQLLLENEQNPDSQLLGKWITDYHPNFVKPIEQIEQTVDNHPESFVLNIGQQIGDCFTLEKWMELTNLFNLFIEKEDYGVIQIIYNALWNCGENASIAYKKFVNSIQWASFGEPFYRDQVEIVGQMGIGIMIQFHELKMYKHAFEVIKTLHNFSIVYFEIQKSLQLAKYFRKQSFFISSMLLTHNEVALRAVKVCYEMGQILDAFLILNACSWCQDLLNEDEKDEKRRILNEMLCTILTSSWRMNRNNQILKEILINGVRLVEELLKLTENNCTYMSEYEELFNEFFVLVLNLSLKNEGDRLMDIFQRSLLKCGIHLSPAIERGMFVLISRSGGNLEPLFRELTLHGIFCKNNVSKRTVTVKSFFTTEELQANFRRCLKNLYPKVKTKKKDETPAEKYLLKIKVILRSQLLKDCCSVESLEVGSTLESCYSRITDVLTKKLSPPLEIALNKTEKLRGYELIILKPNSVYMYISENFNFTDPLMLECSSFSGGTSTETSSIIPNHFHATAARSLLSRNSLLPNNPSPIRNTDRSALNLNTKSESSRASTSGYDPKLNKIQNCKNLKPPKGVLKLQTPKKFRMPFKMNGTPIKKIGMRKGATSNLSARFENKSTKVNLIKLNLQRTVNNIREEPLSPKSPNFETPSIEIPCKKDLKIKTSWAPKTQISLKSSSDQRSAFIPKSPDTEPSVCTVSININENIVIKPPCHVSDAVWKKIEQFLTMEIKKTKKDISLSKSLTQTFIAEMYRKYKCEILNLNPKMMKELFAFAKTNI